MKNYQYLLIRYVPDMERMEPMNVGVILQGEGFIDLRMSPDAAKRKAIDTTVFRQWRQFFIDEIRGEATTLFQPEKNSRRFLSYLSQLCEGPVVLSRPLAIQVAEPSNFMVLLDELYSRLVAHPELVSPEAATRPAGRFRQIQEEKKFLQRGMKRHAHVSVDGERLWMAYRQVDNGDLIAVDKVEVATQIGSTSYEIERLPRIAELLPQFIKHSARNKPTRHFLLADEMGNPFTGQSEVEFRAMQDDLEKAVEQVRNAGAMVLRNRREVENLTEELDKKLPSPQAE